MSQLQKLQLVVMQLLVVRRMPLQHLCPAAAGDAG
jgi:hypothetical protein